MSHSHHGHLHGGDDGGGGHDHGCHDEHDHDHDRAGDGEQQSLYAQIDRDNVVALNAESESMGRDVIKPRDAIEDETRFCQSEEDGEFMIRIPFTDTVKLRSIILRNGGGRAKGPEKMHVYSNASPDFSDLEGIEPTQSFDLVETSSPVTYNVRIAKFSSVTHLTLHFPTPTSASYEADSPTRITYLSFSGAALNLRRDLPTGVVYEAAPRPADHRVKDGDGGGGNWASQGWTSDQ